MQAPTDAQGRPLATFAKVSPPNTPGDQQNRFIGVYCDDFRDKEVRNALGRHVAGAVAAVVAAALVVAEHPENIQSNGTISFKPDVYTHLGIYRDNPWGIYPVLYRKNWKVGG